MILLYRLLYINVNSRIENEPKSQMDENTLSLSGPHLLTLRPQLNLRFCQTAYTARYFSVVFRTSS